MPKASASSVWVNSALWRHPRSIKAASPYLASSSLNTSRQGTGRPLDFADGLRPLFRVESFLIGRVFVCTDIKYFHTFIVFIYDIPTYYIGGATAFNVAVIGIFGDSWTFFKRPIMRPFWLIGP